MVTPQADKTKETSVFLKNMQKTNMYRQTWLWLSGTPSQKCLMDVKTVPSEKFSSKVKIGKHNSK